MYYVAAVGRCAYLGSKDLEPDFPFEFLVEGTPVSLQARGTAAKEEWKRRIKEASGHALPEGHFTTDKRIAITLYYFPDEEMQGDLDNIVKPILDALERHIYRNDSQVDRIVVQRFEPDSVFEFRSPSNTLSEALDKIGPILYVRLSTNPFEDLA